MLKHIRFVFYTELLLLFRRSQEWLYPVGFFVIVVSLFPLAFTPDPVFLQKYVPGCIWIAAMLASLLSIGNSFASDIEDGHLEQLFLHQTPLSLILLAKLSAIWMATQLPLILLTPLLGVLFHLSLQTIIALALSLLFGTPLLTLIGSLCTALTLGLRQQGMLLGLLILPLLSPVLIFGVAIVQQSQAALPIVGPLAFLAGFSLLLISLLPWVIAATLRVGLDS